MGLIEKWLLRKRWLYLIVGANCILFLLFELSVPNLPKEATPDYIRIQQDYGTIVKGILGYIEARFASGTNYLNVAIVLFLILFCLHLEKSRFNNKGKTFNFFGFIQNINQTFNENDKS